MHLLREIADLAVSSHEPLSNVLRKCVILNATLKNATLRNWLQLELNGYTSAEQLPDHRIIRTQAKGHFSGPFGAAINNATLPPIVLPEKLRHWATCARLTQPIAAYDAAVKARGQDSLKIPWPQDLVVYVQGDFYEGYALAQAWQVLPISSIISLCDTVRNRVLEFALEIDETLAGYGENVKSLPNEEVTKSVTTIIYGDNNFVSGSARDIINGANNSVSKGDWSSLEKVVAAVGFEQEDIQSLKNALEADKTASDGKEMGEQTASWMARAFGKVSKGGMKVGLDVAGGALTAAVTSYLGLS
ncbi:hypothetical protein [Methylorubrum extorquens]|uniref:AbiTii domain-containing protein n=1 Tax=Methylorubrum extorquens TaxID=408 RepID=A0AAX3WBS6_METEX|nr:hypothetical protein [Methylorubrum extorquens]WHQ68865.1 hypothetical protein KEC54_21340 [Methylorubrum extorquens]